MLAFSVLITVYLIMMGISGSAIICARLEKRPDGKSLFQLGFIYA